MILRIGSITYIRNDSMGIYALYRMSLRVVNKTCCDHKQCYNQSKSQPAQVHSRRKIGFLNLL